MAADNSGAWMIDLDHRLYRHQDRKWLAEAGTLPLRAADPRMYTPRPSLALGAGGSLWLFASGQGLWRRNGRDWEPVVPAGHAIGSAHRMEARSGRLWFWEKARVVEFDPASNRVEIYSADRFGLDRAARVTEVIRSGDRIFVLTERDWFRLAEGKLQKMMLPAPDRPRVSRGRL